MLERLFTHCLLTPADLTPTDPQLQVVGAFNPGVVATADGLAMLVRVVQAPVEQRDGHVSSPRYDLDGQLHIDWFEACDCDTGDPRVFIHRPAACARLRFISHLQVVLLEPDGRTIARMGPAIMPKGSDETYGIEDPRITKIGNTCHITYVAVSPKGINTNLMSTTDFASFDRHGTIFIADNKDVVLFPEKIVGEYVALHRPMLSLGLGGLAIWLARSPDMQHWGAFERVATGNAAYETDRIGAGTVPILTDRGWLMIYHGSDRKPGQKGAGTYAAGTMLLDGHNPGKVLARSNAPILKPEEAFEREGYVPNVIFPTALVPTDDHDLIYYGAADEAVGVLAVRRADLLASAETVE